MKQKKSGFTVIETTLVVVILGILLTMAIPMFADALAQGKDTRRWNEIRTLARIILLKSNELGSQIYDYDHAELENLMQKQSARMPESGSLFCFVYGVSENNNNFYVAVQSEENIGTFFVEGSVGGKSDFVAEANLQNEIQNCTPLTVPTTERNYTVFYL